MAKLYLRNLTAETSTSQLKTNLISWWNLEEASGQRNDSHGTNHLTDNNTVTQATGRVGSAAQFTAANSEKLNITSNASLQTGNIDFSFAGWVYLDTKTANRGFWGKWNLASNNDYLCYYDLAGDRFYWGLDGPTTSIFHPANSLGSPATGVWYFIYVEHDSVNNFARIQVNNGTMDSGAYSDGVSVGTAPFDIGYVGDGIIHDGRIDSVGFWKRTLTADEKTWLYNGGNGRSYSELPPRQSPTDGEKSTALPVGTFSGNSGSGFED